MIIIILLIIIIIMVDFSGYKKVKTEVSFISIVIKDLVLTFSLAAFEEFLFLLLGAVIVTL